MPARGRIPGARNKDSRPILAAVREFIKYRSNVTVRQCLYHVLTLGLLPSTEKKYEIKLYGLLSRARVAGEIDDEPFVDDHCTVHTGGYDGWTNLKEYMAPKDIDYYTRNKWQDQPKHPTDVWLEKNTIAEAVRPITWKWDCTLRIGSGCYGRAFLFQAAKELSKVTKPIVILFGGDFDPAGLDLERAARKGNDKKHDRRREGLEDILIKNFGWTAKRFKKQVTWVRFAATEEDLRSPAFRKYTVSVKQVVIDPKTGRPESGDTRSPAYVRKYGTRCLEIEALGIVQKGSLAKRLETAILRYGVNRTIWTDPKPSNAGKRKRANPSREVIRLAAQASRQVTAARNRFST